MDFSFLNTVTINKVEEQKKASTGRVKMQRNPENSADLRLFKDGSIYPSLDAVDKYDLEYNKEKTGNGFDIFASSNWKQYPVDAQDVVFISVVPKSAARVDVFGSAREVNGEIGSVLSQGSKTFGKQLISMLENTYGMKLFYNQKYIDLKIVDEVSIPVGDIVYIPKMVVKGEHTGMMTTERRENAVIHPLAIYSNNESSEIINEEVEEPELELV